MHGGASDREQEKKEEVRGAAWARMGTRDRAERR